MVRHRWWRAAAIVVAAVLLGALMLSEDTNASALAGPLRTNPLGPGSESFAWLDPGATASMTVHGVLEGHSAATVTGVRLLPLPGAVTPILRHVALLTGRGEGVVHGWPKPDSDLQHRPLIGIPVPPTRNLRILVGFTVGYVERPTFYAAAGIQIDYTAGGRPHTTRLYDGMYTCVRFTCDAAVDRALTGKLFQEPDNH